MCNLSLNGDNAHRMLLLLESISGTKCNSMYGTQSCERFRPAPIIVFQIPNSSRCVSRCVSRTFADVKESKRCKKKRYEFIQSFLELCRRMNTQIIILQMRKKRKEKKK